MEIRLQMVFALLLEVVQAEDGMGRVRQEDLLDAPVLLEVGFYLSGRTRRAESVEHANRSLSGDHVAAESGHSEVVEPKRYGPSTRVEEVASGGY